MKSSNGNWGKLVHREYVPTVALGIVDLTSSYSGSSYYYGGGSYFYSQVVFGFQTFGQKQAAYFRPGSGVAITRASNL